MPSGMHSRQWQSERRKSLAVVLTSTDEEERIAQLQKSLDEERMRATAKAEVSTSDKLPLVAPSTYVVDRARRSLGIAPGSDSARASVDGSCPIGNDDSPTPRGHILPTMKRWRAPEMGTELAPSTLAQSGRRHSMRASETEPGLGVRASRRRGRTSRSAPTSRRSSEGRDSSSTQNVLGASDPARNSMPQLSGGNAIDSPATSRDGADPGCEPFQATSRYTFSTGDEQETSYFKVPRYIS